MPGYIGSKAVLLSTTAANVAGNAEITGDLTVDTSTLFVDSTNNRVGVGTTSALTELHVKGSGDYAALTLEATTSGGASYVNLGDSADIDVGQLAYFNSDNSMRFTTNASERMRIDSSGNLLVAATSVINSSSGKIQVKHPGATTNGIGVMTTDATGYLCAFYNSSTIGVGNIYTNGTTTAYNTSSDYRLKEDVQPMVGASDRVLALNPVNFAWKVDGSRVDGFLAHEAQAVVPEAVTGVKDAVDEDGNPQYQGIDQSKLVPLLTAALQEALTEITDLKARVAALEAV